MLPVYYGPLQPPPALTPPQPPPFATLGDVLDKTPWNVAERGPLIFLKEIRTRKPKTLLTQNLSLRNDAGAFDLRLVNVGTITVLAPAMMRVPNPTSRAGWLYAYQRRERF
jgi:hypothetical protein